jgi:hypothetical protein
MRSARISVRVRGGKWPVQNRPTLVCCYHMLRSPEHASPTRRSESYPPDPSSVARSFRCGCVRTAPGAVQPHPHPESRAHGSRRLGFPHLKLIRFRPARASQRPLVDPLEPSRRRAWRGRGPLSPPRGAAAGRRPAALISAALTRAVAAACAVPAAPAGVVSRTATVGPASAL